MPCDKPELMHSQSRSRTPSHLPRVPLKSNIKKDLVCYLCCDSCLRLGRASIPDNRSTSPWSCTAHTPGCTSGDCCSSPPLHMSCYWSPGGAQGDTNTRPPFLVPWSTGDCSPLWLRGTYLGSRKDKHSQRGSDLKEHLKL